MLQIKIITIFTVLSLMLVLETRLALSQEKELIGQPQLIEDARQMVTLLETVHPQPYYNAGGKLAFHLRFQKVLDSIPENGMTREDFRELLSPLVASLKDGHTHVYPDGPTDFDAIPAYFLVAEQDLYVAAVVEEQHRSLLGARLFSVEDVPVAEILNRTQDYYGADNIYGTLAQLANFELFLSKRSVLEDLIPEWENKSLINVSFLMPAGDIQKVRFQAHPRENINFTAVEKGIELPALNGREFVSGFLTEDRKVAYLRVRGMTQNRETFEKRATYSDVSEDARDFYQSVYGEDATGAPESIIEALPSLTETYTDLVVQMKEANSNALIIDLRTNIGGFALAADMLVYFLYGKEALIDLHRRVNIAGRKLSPEYFNDDPDQTLSEINASTINGRLRAFQLNENDFDFRDYERLENGLLSQQYAKQLVEEDLALSKTFHAEYLKGTHANYYIPENVFVITDVATFSAGFMFAKYLELLGGKIVGNSPSQNIMQMGETFHYELKNSKLGGAISRSSLVHDSTLINSENPENIMIPDHQLTYEKLKEFNFARNAEILLALEILKNCRLVGLY